MVKYGRCFHFRGSLTWSASAIGRLDASNHTGAAGVTEPQNNTEQMLPPIFRLNMHCYSDFSLRGGQQHTQLTARVGVWVDDERTTLKKSKS